MELSVQSDSGSTYITLVVLLMIRAKQKAFQSLSFQEPSSSLINLGGGTSDQKHGSTGPSVNNKQFTDRETWLS